jgi:DNA invertase Pin-like site-specific DNA recombinase
VSTDGQSLTAQIAELKAAKCERIYQEKASGAKSDRKQLAKLMASLEQGDVVVVTRLDRLARSTLHLLTTLSTVTKAGAGFKSLNGTWADTTTVHGRLMLTVLAGLAEFERELIVARTGEGRKRAMANGVKFGRPAKLTPHQARSHQAAQRGRGPHSYREGFQRQPPNDWPTFALIRIGNACRSPAKSSRSRVRQTMAEQQVLQ